MTSFSFLQRLRLSSRTGGVLGLTVLSLLLLMMHVLAVRDMRSTGLPAASVLPVLEQRLHVLTEQAEISELQAALGGGAEEEAVRRFVLPLETEADRLLETLDTLFEVLRTRHDLSAVSAVETGDKRREVMPEGQETDVTLLPVRFEANVTEEGLVTLLHFFDTAGMLTISDALTPEETALLLRLTEQENPAAVTALERFLAADLLHYAQSPKPFQDQLLSAFSSTEFRQTLLRLTGNSTLQNAVQLLSTDLGTALSTRKLWPLRFMQLTNVEVTAREDGMWHVKVEVEVGGRVN